MKRNTTLTHNSITGLTADEFGKMLYDDVMAEISGLCARGFTRAEAAKIVCDSINRESFWRGVNSSPLGS